MNFRQPTEASDVVIGCAGFIIGIVAFYLVAVQLHRWLHAISGGTP